MSLLRGQQSHSTVSPALSEAVDPVEGHAEGAPGSEQTQGPRTNRFAGIGSGITLLIWGGILLYCPTFFHYGGLGATLTYVAAMLILLVSVGVTFNEAGKVWRREALSSLGNALVGIIPAVLLYAFTQFKPFPEPWETIGRMGAVLFAFLGAIFLGNLVVELPSLITRVGRQTEPPPEDNATILGRRSERIKSTEALLAAVLSLATTAVGLVTLVLHLIGSH